MTACIITGLILSCFGAAGETMDGITFTRAFDTKDPGGRYKHPAAITELGNGDLYIAFYGGTGEYGEDTSVWGARRKKGAENWNAPAVIADTPWRSDGNPVVWQAPDGLVWLFYVCRYGETWSESRIKAKVSRDGAKTWTDPFMLAWDLGMMVRGKPIVLHDGDYLLPIYHETGGDREEVGDDTTSLFLRCDPDKKTWTETNRVTSRCGNLQPAPAQLTGDHLIAFCRRGGGYEKDTGCMLVRTESHDGGRTWSEGEETEFPNPNAAVDLLKLDNGHLILFYNDSPVDRTPLTAAVSMDNGETWPIKKNLREGIGPYAYPYAIQAKDGKIHLIYTSHNRTVINHAVFEEEALLK
jgi:predicted neuraminidase